MKPPPARRSISIASSRVTLVSSIFTDAASTLRERPGQMLLRHMTSTLQIDVISPTSAKSRCYYHVLMTHGLDHWGRYIDEYRVVEGRWRFARRRVTLDGRAEASLMAPRQT